MFALCTLSSPPHSHSLHPAHNTLLASLLCLTPTHSTSLGRRTQRKKRKDYASADALTKIVGLCARLAQLPIHGLLAILAAQVVGEAGQQGHGPQAGVPARIVPYMLKPQTRLRYNHVL